LFFKQHELIGSTMGSYEEFATVTELVRQGLPVVVDRAVALDEYPTALDRLSAGRQLGKLVLEH
jgi:D-arabinose 1-dehydrogenase-like Zn-dependent alcohol dehydrogenase